MSETSAKTTFRLVKLEEEDRLLPQLERIFAWVKKLQELSLPQAYAFYPPGISLKLRKDVPCEFPDSRKLLELSPKIEKDHFVVPRVI
jgi:aspartyl/glutamyl-tRNA(Asn/Gln) amidotransferase C subunit